MVESKQERSFVMEPFVSNPLQLFFFFNITTLVNFQGAELAASIELGASCTSGDINTLLSQIESMGLQG